MAIERDRPGPVTQAPLEEELARRGAWLIRLRWVAVAAVFAGTFVTGLLTDLPVPGLAFCVVGALILGYNLLFRRILRHLKSLETTTVAWGRFASAQFLTDWGALIVLVHLTGGIASPLLFFFVFHAILASILLPPKSAYLHAAFGVLLVGLLATIEGVGLLPHRPMVGFEGVEHGEFRQVVVRFLFFATAILFTTHLAGSIARRLWARTMELLRMKDSVEAAFHRTRTLYDIARAVNSTLDLSQVLNTVVARTTVALNGKACSIRLLDDDGTRLRLSAAYGLSDTYLQKGDVDPAKSPVDQSAMMGWAVQVPDVTDAVAFQYPEEVRREGIRSVVVAPMLLRGTAIGVLRLYTAERREFGDEDIGFLMAIASQGAVAIENARAYRHLEELEAAKAKFVFLVLHELKTPVASLRSSLSILEEGFLDELDERKRSLVARMVRRVSGLQDLLKDLMALGSMKGRVPGRAAGTADLCGVVRGVLEKVQAEAERKRIQMEVVIPASEVTLRGDDEDLDKIVGNLVENAVKYTPDGGRVQVTLVADQNRARLVCRDSGIGISEDALTHVFDEFYRAGNAKQFAEGTGLGLSLVKRLVDMYRGEIEVTSSVGEGSTFTVSLPLQG
jgi:signal transduction histidine kinase